MPESSVMGMDLLATSEVIVGLILSGKQTATQFTPDYFAGDYGKMVTDLKAGKKKEDLVGKYGTTKVQSAISAAHSVNGLGTELDWTEILNVKYNAESVIQAMDKVKRLLGYGEVDKAADLLRLSTATLSSTQRLNSVLASEISDDYEAYIPSGSKAWDKHVGGLPNVGVTVVGAKTFTGKTTLAISMMEAFLNEYPSKKILFVTLEDMNEGWKYRAKQILGGKEKAFWDRIYVMEFSENTSTILQEAARHPDIGLIIVDYLEYMVKESDVSTYTEVYKTLSTGAKTLAVTNAFRSMPIILLAQFGKTLYKGGVPTPEALPYVDQRFVYQQVMLYQPEGDFYADNEENPYTLPGVPKKGYIIFWKTKNMKPHDPDFPGAIQVPHSSKYGYNLDCDGEWFSLAADTKRAVKRRK